MQEGLWFRLFSSNKNTKCLEPCLQAISCICIFWLGDEIGISCRVNICQNQVCTIE